MTIPGCQLDYIWNELQSRIEELTCDPDLEAGRYKFLTWILAWRSWGIVTMKSLGSGKVVHTFNPSKLRQRDLWVQGQPGTKQVPDPGVVAHTFNLGHTFCWRSTRGHWKKEDSILLVCLHLLASTSVKILLAGGGWRHGSAVKHWLLFQRFNSQQPHGGSQPSVVESDALFWYVWKQL
jgi:hypothetical protein